MSDGPQKVVVNHLGDVATQLSTGDEVEPEMHPAKMRLNVASRAAAENLVNERSAPGRTSDVTLKANRS